jgi:hypothetical protein
MVGAAFEELATAAKRPPERDARRR